VVVAATVATDLHTTTETEIKEATLKPPKEKEATEEVEVAEATEESLEEEAAITKTEDLKLAMVVAAAIKVVVAAATEVAEADMEVAVAKASATNQTNHWLPSLQTLKKPNLKKLSS
jgi:hypothetical protein